MRTLLFSLVIYAVGCVVPAPLEAGSVPGAATVVVLAGEPVNFGFYNPDPSDKGWWVGVLAQSQAGQQLSARWLLQDTSTNYFPIGGVIHLTPQGDPTHYEGMFPTNSWCDIVKGQKLTWVYVTNGVFNESQTNPGKPGFVQAGDAQRPGDSPSVDGKYWVIQCPA